MPERFRSPNTSPVVFAENVKRLSREAGSSDKYSCRIEIYVFAKNALKIRFKVLIQRKWDREWSIHHSLLSFKGCVPGLDFKCAFLCFIFPFKETR